MSTKLLNLINKGFQKKDASIARDLLKHFNYPALKNLVKSEIRAIEQITNKIDEDDELKGHKDILDRLPYLDLLSTELDIFVMDDLDEIYTTDYD